MLASTLFVLAAANLHAQSSTTPKVELSVGYSYLHADWLADTEVFSGSVPYGAVFAANFNVSHSLGIVVDLAGHYKSEEIGSSDFGLTVGSLHGGLRFSGRGNPRITPYVQLLAGGTSYQADIDGEEFGELETEFSIQPGVGVIVGLSDTVGLELGGSYRRIFADEGANEFRLNLGVAFRIGSK
jgi:hypothetical protein